MKDNLLWFDVATLGLDTNFSNIIEMAYIPEQAGSVGEARSMLVQPVLFSEDYLYGDTNPYELIKKYNSKLHPLDPASLRVFTFENSDPLFFYTLGSLTFNLPPGSLPRKPEEWILGRQRMPAPMALQKFTDDLGSMFKAPTRIALAGHNVEFDFKVLTNWVRRLLPEKESEAVMNKINAYFFLDTLSLSRWFGYSEKLQTNKFKLETIAQTMGIKTDKDQGALGEIELSRLVARKLLGMAE